jgi:hypothetical protein
MGNERQLMSRRREDFMRQNRQLRRQNQAREQEEEQLRRLAGTMRWSMCQIDEMEPSDVTDDKPCRI